MYVMYACTILQTIIILVDRAYVFSLLYIFLFIEKSYNFI